MQKLILIITVFTFLSCASDNLEEYYGLADCETNEATFSGDIRAIIATNCAVPECHVQGTGLPAFTDYEKIAENADIIKFQTSAGAMPPASSGQNITIEEVRKIACWVDSGAKNN